MKRRQSKSPSELRQQVVLLGFLTLASFSCATGQFKHKSEAQIAAMTPAQRVDEFAYEQAYHKYNILDAQRFVIEKYVLRDGLKAVPRMIEIMNEYDPTRSGETGHRGERFDAMWILLDDLDSRVVRLRASPEGRQAIDALERAINRMRAAGYGQNDQHEWAQHGRFNLAGMTLKHAKAINSGDTAIQDTFWVKYNLKVSDEELLAFTTCLIARDPTYPSWSEVDLIKDYSRLNEAGNPAQVYVMKSPDRFYEAYLAFKKSNLCSKENSVADRNHYAEIG
jgi:hypothetical protein